MKKRKLKIAALLSLGFIILVLFLVDHISPVYNHKLQAFSHNFTHVPLPGKTFSSGKIYKEFGLMGNGNHCDYFVGMLINSELSKSELEKYYRSHTIPPADPKGTMAYSYSRRDSTPVEINVWQPWNANQITGPGPYSFYYFKEGKGAVPEEEMRRIAEDYGVNISVISKKTFVVSAFDPGYEPAYLICH